MTNTETAFPQFLADYIDAGRDSVSLPAAAVMPCRVGPAESDNVFPKIYLVTEKITLPHPRRAVLSVVIQIQSRMEKTTLADEETWCAGLHRLLSDGEGIRIYLAGLTQPPAFALRRLRITGMSTAIDVEKQERAREVTVEAYLIPHETAPL